MSSLVCLLCACYICGETVRTLPIGTWMDPGPGLWPLSAGLMLGGLSAVVLLRSRAGKSPQEKVPWYPGKTWRRIAAVILALLLCTAVMEWLGYPLATFLLMICLFRVAEPRKWAVTLGGSAVIALASYWLFQQWLGTQLPRGLWEF
jgi:hypothetical protein